MGFIFEYRMGEPIEARKTRIYPISKSAALLPGAGAGGLIWNRPHAVLVQEPDGSETILRVRDVTRERQIILLVFGALGAFLLWLVNRA